MSLFNTMGAVAGGYLRGQQLHQAEQLNQAHLETLNLQNELIKSRMGALQGLQGLFQPEQAQPAQQPSQQPSQGGMPWHPPLMPGTQDTNSDSAQAAQKLLSPETNPLTQQSSSLLKAANFLASQGDQVDAEKYMGMAQKLSQMGMTASKEALVQRTSQLSNGIKEASFVAQAAGAGETPQAFQDSIKQGMQMGIIDPQMGQKLLQTPWTPALMQRLQTVGTTRAEQLRAEHDQAQLESTEAYRNQSLALRASEVRARDAYQKARLSIEAKRVKSTGEKVVAAPTTAMINAAQQSLVQTLGLDSKELPTLGTAPTIVAETAQELLKTNPNMTTAQAIQTAVSQLQASGAINVKDNSASVENSGDTEFNAIPLEVKNGKPQLPTGFKGTKYFRVPSKMKVGGKILEAGTIIKISG